jgi:hypothetical protein
LSIALVAIARSDLGGARSAIPAPPRRLASLRLASQHKGLWSLPVSARGSLSDALGARNPSFRIDPSRGGYRAVNPAQHLHMRFTRAGISLASGPLRLDLRLRAVGYGGELRALPDVSPSAKDNHVSYSHGGVSEWYANGPLGVEQGFTVARAVVRHASGSLTLAISLSGNAHASLTSSQRGITLSHAGATLLEYSGLIATDARHRVLHSSLSLKGRSLVINVDATDARYPLKIDPFVQRGGKLVGGGDEVEPHDQFGYSVALSSDGHTALIGAPNDLEGYGAAFVFSHFGEVWSQQAKLALPSGESTRAELGASVAVSSDGNTALLGAPNDESKRGAAWIFARKGGGWVQVGSKLTGNEESGEGTFGHSVALSAEGDTALIGGPGDANFHGAAWAFTSSGSKWEQQGGKLVANALEETGQGFFGESVALSSSGSTALVGAPYKNAGSTGAAWVFTRTGTTWSQDGPMLTPNDGTGGGFFGCSVALSSDGNTALLGGLGDSEFTGAAWVFTRATTTWEQQGKKLTGSEEIPNATFGDSVALSSDGGTALVGGLTDNNAKGAAWSFVRTGTTWQQDGPKLTPNDETGSGAFGVSVALSAQAAVALIGGSGDNAALGAAWVFTPAPPPPVVSLGGPADATVTSQAQPTFTWSASDENGSGIAHIEFLLNGAPLGGDLPANATSFTPAIALRDGTYTWQVRAVDTVGVVATTPARTIVIDTTPPTTPALLQPPGGNIVYQATPAFSWATSTDATSGVNYYVLVIDGSQATTVRPSACARDMCSTASPRMLSNGTHSWQVLATDRAGNTAASAIEGFTVAVGPSPPPGRVGVSINNGNYATNTPRVVLDVVWPRGANEALISNDGGFKVPGETTLRPVAAQIPWTLRSAGSERLPKTVYVRFPDSVTPTETFTDDIILDTTTPVIQSAKLLGSSGGRAHARHSGSYRIRLKAHESVSGISLAQFSETRSGGTIVRFRSPQERGVIQLSQVIQLSATSASARAQDFTSSLPQDPLASSSTIKVRPPHRPRWVRVQSTAGTWSPWRRLS